jgi:hypothetical protein
VQVQLQVLLEHQSHAQAVAVAVVTLFQDLVVLAVAVTLQTQLHNQAL